MVRFTPKYRPWAFLLALVMALDPLVVPILQAQELPKPEINTKGIKGVSDVSDVMTPSEYLDYMLMLRQAATKDDLEQKVWGDWMQSISGAYMLMDAGSQEVFSFYAAAEIIKGLPETAAQAADFLKLATKKTALLIAFVGKTADVIQSAGGFRSSNLFSGFLQMGVKAGKLQKWLEGHPTFKFLEFMAPPPAWANSKVAGTGFKSYLRWARKKTINPSGKGLGRGRYITDLKGVAQTVGIGLCVFGIALDCYSIDKSDDRQGGRPVSYDLVKNYVSLALGVATLVAMFCIPVVGQIIAIATLVWMVLTTVGDFLGEYNKRWKEAYKNSYWFLSQNDPAFRTFYENRGQLKREEKSMSLIITERRYGIVKTQTEPADPAEKKVWENSKSVYEALEKQGVLMTYYAQTGFNLPNFDLDRLEELWRKKADFMSWKPTEPEADAAKKRGFWGNLGHSLNPKTWISWAGDKIQSRGFDKEFKAKDVKPVFFNPDFVLMKKYQNYLMAKDLKGGIYSIVGLRIEQAPFNYIPLVGIDSGSWNKKLLEQAFNADAFQVGVKEMMFFREQAKAGNESVEKVMKDSDKYIEKIVNDDLPQTEKVRKALEALLEAYNDDRTRKVDDLMDKCRKAFGWRWNDNNGKPTPENIIKIYQADIEQALNYIPLSIAQKAAETVLMVVTVKHQLDTAKIMRAMGDEKLKVLAGFDDEFTNSAINKYLRKGTFLDVKGKTIMDWLGEVYPAYDELEKFTNLFNKEADKYSKSADTANSSTRDRWWWSDKEVTSPKDLLKKLNDELSEFKRLTEDYDVLKDTLNLPIVSDDNYKKGIYRDNGYELGYDPTPMDINNPILAPSAPDVVPE